MIHLVYAITLQQKGSIARTTIARAFCPCYISINSDGKTLSSLNSNSRGKYCLDPYSEDLCPRNRSNVITIVFPGKFYLVQFWHQMFTPWLTHIARTFQSQYPCYMFYILTIDIQQENFLLKFWHQNFLPFVGI